MLAHSLLWGVLLSFSHFKRPFHTSTTTKIQEENIEILVLDPPPSLAPLPKKKVRQVVEQINSKDKRKPKEAKYLSAENQSVEKETRAEKVGDFNNEAGKGVSNNTRSQSPPPPKKQNPSPAPPRVAKEVPQKSTPTTPPPQPPHITTTPETSTQKPTVTKPQPPPPLKNSNRLSLQANDLPTVTSPPPSLKDLLPKVNLQAHKTSPPSTPPPTPSANAESSDQPLIQKGKSGRESASRDYLKDKEKGLQTLLNTREFAFYTYYQRIRNKIQFLWEPAIEQKVRHLFRQGRRIASTQNHITKVMIVLNHQGQLEKVQVLEKSSWRDLDSAAVEAFRAAEPFPNPPKGIVEKDGKIRIRWDFILEV